MLKGKTYKYGDNVDTDVIIPARYLNSSSEENLKAHAMEDIDATFASTVNIGDIIVAGQNFGCGSSREHAPLALKLSGIQCVVAKSFARIFFRNAINIGLYVVESEDIANQTSNGDILTISNGVLENQTTSKKYILPTLDPFVEDIIKNGGLIGTARKMLKD